MNKEMLNEAEILKEVGQKVFRMSYKITNAIYLGYQKELILVEKKLDAHRLESENEIHEYKSRIETRRDESKIESE